MKVRTEVNSVTARKEVNRGAEVGVVVFFEHQGISYPGKNWNDFAIRLFGFWLEQIIQVRDGRTSTPMFKFLDGDFCLYGSIGSDGIVDLLPQNADVEFSWRLHWAKVERAVIDSSKELRACFLELDLQPRGIEGIDAGLRCLADP
jgi:hypothetical protein